MTQDEKIDQDLQDTLGDEAVHNLRQVLQKIDANWASPQTARNHQSTSAPTPVHSAVVRRLPLNRILAIAATILVLAVAGIWLLTPDSYPESPAELYADYGRPYSTTLLSRGASLTTQEEAAFSASEAGRYGDAYAGFSDLLALNPSEPFYAFYAGNAALANGQPLAAIPYFSGLIEQSDYLLVEQSRWYLAMAHLAAAQDDESQLARAREVLPQSGPGHYNFEQSKALLADIDALNR